MRAILLSVALALASGAVNAQGEVETADPLKAFVFEQYRRGSDYFINGNGNTVLLRCVADFNHDGRSDIALSEKSIWGNRTGPFEIFVRESNGRFRYLRTVDYESALRTACGARLESCASSEYLSSGKCRWKKGWQHDRQARAGGRGRPAQ